MRSDNPYRSRAADTSINSMTDTMHTILLHLILMGLLLGFSAFVSCAETALFSLNRVELHRIKNATDWATRRLRALLLHPRETLIAILIGNEFSNVAISVVASDLFYNFVAKGWKATLISVVVITPIVLVLGEILPKNLAVHTAPIVAPILAPPLEFFVIVTRPLRSILTRLSDWAVRLFGGDPSQVRALIVEEEFRDLVDIGQETGALSPAEVELIHRVFTFGDLRVDEVMTPAYKMFRIPLGWSLERVLENVGAAQYSRIPVYSDHPDDLVGVLYVRDLFSLSRQRERGFIKELEEIVRPVLFVECHARLEEILREFQQKKIHIAVVVDVDRKPIGVITMDDILDALFGREAA